MDLNVKVELPDSIDNATKNLTDKPSKEGGNLITDWLYNKFGNIHYQADVKRLIHKHGLQMVGEQLKNNVSFIPPEKLCEPDFQTLYLAVSNVECCADSKELRDSFSQLMANCFNIDYKDYIHPSYSEILKQMSPLDAKTLKVFSDFKSQHLLEYSFLNGNQMDAIYSKVPYIFQNSLNYGDVEHVSRSMSSLIRFGLLEIKTATLVSFASNTDFEKSEYYIRSEEQRIISGEYKDSRITRMSCILTPLGIDFVKVCIVSPEDLVSS